MKNEVQMEENVTMAKEKFEDKDFFGKTFT